jgi:hypothetical protein
MGEKIWNFMLISNMQTCLSNKVLPTKSITAKNTIILVPKKRLFGHDFSKRWKFLNEYRNLCTK